ncbi:MAG: hypothetical protein ACREI3_12975, partial [Nitrospirales bacterium]
WTEALVEARKVDHRLNVLTDRVDDADAYRNDAFARYVTGVLYEATGDLNNAFIAYRNAYEEYQRARAWSHTPVPEQLKADLLRTTDALFLKEEHTRYRQAFEGVGWRSVKETKDLAQLVVISYNGRAPRKEDLFLDLPISAEALHLVLLTKGATRGGHQNARVAESVLYGLSGQVVRVALPRLVPQKSSVNHVTVTARSDGQTVRAETELVQNLTAVAEKSLRDQFAKRAAKAVARAALKFGLAEGAGIGARAAAGKDAGPVVGLLVGLLAKIWAVSSEEADKRSWRTLPDHIQLARLWVPRGAYELDLRPLGSVSSDGRGPDRRSVSVERGETRLVIERIVR